MPELSFQEFGQGQPILLIHGFPMNQSIWKDFAAKLSAYFRVFTVDLPGVGRSSMPSESFSIDSIGSEVLKWVLEMGIGKCVVIGHSLGGYVALAMAEQAPEKFAGIGLFHSTALADTEEKKQSRNKVVEFVARNGAPAFTSGFITPLFADKGHPAIERVKAIAVETSAETVTGYTLAMRDRKDRTELLRNFKGPILFIVGKEDPGIPVETIIKQASFCQKPEVHTLASVGHMGMFEAEGASLEIVRLFSKKAFG